MRQLQTYFSSWQRIANVRPSTHMWLNSLDGWWHQTKRQKQSGFGIGAGVCFGEKLSQRTTSPLRTIKHGTGAQEMKPHKSAEAERGSVMHRLSNWQNKPPDAHVWLWRSMSSDCRRHSSSVTLQQVHVRVCVLLTRAKITPCDRRRVRIKN